MLAKTIRAFYDDVTAATAIEYSLVAGLIALAAIGSFALLGDALLNLLGVGVGSAAEIIGEQAAKIN